jgi:hypothetical protein
MSLGLLFLGMFWGFFFFVLSMGRKKASREEVKKSLKRRLLVGFALLATLLVFLFIAQPGA